MYQKYQKYRKQIYERSQGLSNSCQKVCKSDKRCGAKFKIWYVSNFAPQRLSDLHTFWHRFYTHCRLSIRCLNCILILRDGIFLLLMVSFILLPVETLFHLVSGMFCRFASPFLRLHGIMAFFSKTRCRGHYLVHRLPHKHCADCPPVLMDISKIKDAKCINQIREPPPLTIGKKTMAPGSFLQRGRRPSAVK